MKKLEKRESNPASNSLIIKNRKRCDFWNADSEERTLDGTRNDVVVSDFLVADHAQSASEPCFAVRKLAAEGDIRMTTSRLDISQFDHTPFYCEENVYMLCKKLGMIGMADAEGSDLFVVFISNEKKQVPLWHQKASKRADGIILWDYHVICIQKKKEGNSPPQVWDLDSSLPFPSHLDHYVPNSFQPSFQLFSDYQRFFRIIHAPIFLKSFASDRRHMKSSDGNWISPPPAHDPIVADDGSLYNLDEYIRMNGADVVTQVERDTINAVFTSKYGVLVTESQLEEFFSLLSG